MRPRANAHSGGKPASFRFSPDLRSPTEATAERSARLVVAVAPGLFQADTTYSPIQLFHRGFDAVFDLCGIDRGDGVVEETYVLHPIDDVPWISDPDTIHELGVRVADLIRSKKGCRARNAGATQHTCRGQTCRGQAGGQTKVSRARHEVARRWVVGAQPRFGRAYTAWGCGALPERAPADHRWDSDRQEPWREATGLMIAADEIATNAIRHGPASRPCGDRLKVDGSCPRFWTTVRALTTRWGGTSLPADAMDAGRGF